MIVSEFHGKKSEMPFLIEKMKIIYSSNLYHISFFVKLKKIIT